eukprot:6420003-Amphidinium_carterae.2
MELVRWSHPLKVPDVLFVCVPHASECRDIALIERPLYPCVTDFVIDRIISVDGSVNISGSNSTNAPTSLEVYRVAGDYNHSKQTSCHFARRSIQSLALRIQLLRFGPLPSVSRQNQ